MKASNLSVKKLEELAQEMGLKVDEASGIIYGNKYTYDICLKTVDSSYLTTITLSVSLHGGMPEKDSFKSFVKENKALTSCKVDNYRVEFIVASKLTKAKSFASIKEGINLIVEFLQRNGYHNCCESCGNREIIDSYILNGAERLLCDDCFNRSSHDSATQQQQSQMKRENMILGIVGAFLGSMIGVVSIIIIGQLGYVAAISGIIMAACTIKGYELFSGKQSIKGILISCIMMIAMVYLGNQIDWAIYLASYAEVSIFEAFTAIPELLETGYIEPASFYGNLGMIYLFMLGGAVPTIWGTIRDRKNGNNTHKMSNNN